MGQGQIPLPQPQIPPLTVPAADQFMHGMDGVGATTAGISGPQPRPERPSHFGPWPNEMFEAFSDLGFKVGREEFETLIPNTIAIGPGASGSFFDIRNGLTFVDLRAYMLTLQYDPLDWLRANINLPSARASINSVPTNASGAMGFDLMASALSAELLFRPDLAYIGLPFTDHILIFGAEGKYLAIGLRAHIENGRLKVGIAKTFGVSFVVGIERRESDN